MSKFILIFSSSTPFAIAAVTGLLSGYFLKADALNSVTQELIAFFGLVMAGVLPAMVLTASVVRPGVFSVKRLKDYTQALRQQIIFWMNLFFVSLLSSLCVILGKVLDWKIIFVLPIKATIFGLTAFNLAPILNSIIIGGMFFLLLRTIAIANGIISLLVFASELAIGEAKLRDDPRHVKNEKAISQIREPRNFGEIVEIKNRKR